MVTCPKCRHVRLPDESHVPDWQCPACGVAYVKAAEAASAARPGPTPVVRPAFTEPGRPMWIKAVLALVLLAAAWQAPRLRGLSWADLMPRGPAAMTQGGGSGTADELAALAATVRADEVTMYSTTECTYCVQAKDWLKAYGFAFTECNMSTTPHCEAEFRALGATGTPFLVVRGQHMKEGFDSDAFLAILRQSRS